MCEDLFEIENNVLVKVNCSLVNLTIPHIYNGKQIDVIGCNVFSYRIRDPHTDDIEYIGEEDLKYVRISHGIKSIQPNAFRNCPNLHSVHIPYTLERIGKCAFRDCFSLKHILLNTDHISIFEENANDTIEHLRVIEDQAFYKCRSLKSQIVNMKNGMDYIGDEAFAYCESLELAFLPLCRERYGFGIYKHCHLLQSCCIDWRSTQIPDQVFAFCYHLRYLNSSREEDVILPDNVKSIGMYAFTCTAINMVKIPVACKVIHKYAFYNCLDLFQVTLSSNTIVESSVFEAGDINQSSFEVNKDMSKMIPSVSIIRTHD